MEFLKPAKAKILITLLLLFLAAGSFITFSAGAVQCISGTSCSAVARIAFIPAAILAWPTLLGVSRGTAIAGIALNVAYLYLAACLAVYGYKRMR